MGVVVFTTIANKSLRDATHVHGWSDVWKCYLCYAANGNESIKSVQYKHTSAQEVTAKMDKAKMKQTITLNKIGDFIVENILDDVRKQVNKLYNMDLDVLYRILSWSLIFRGNKHFAVFFHCSLLGDFTVLFVNVSV